MTPDQEYRAMCHFKPPSKTLVRGLALPLRQYFKPKLYGLENISRGRPQLFVGNHSVFSTDSPLWMASVYLNTGVYPRGMADHFHFRMPGWRDMVLKGGAVRGTRDNCSWLMRNGHSILVYPGGGREVMKRRGEEYVLQWKDRTGFCKLAMEHGYQITPFCVVGGEEMWRIVADGNDFQRFGIQALLERSGLNKLQPKPDEVPPIVRGVGPTLLPRPEMLHMAFGKPIDAAEWQSKAEDKEQQLRLQRLVKAEVEGLIASTREKQGAMRKHYSLLRQVFT